MSLYHCDHLTEGTVCWLSACVSRLVIACFTTRPGLLSLMVAHPGEIYYLFNFLPHMLAKATECVKLFCLHSSMNLIQKCRLMSCYMTVNKKNIQVFVTDIFVLSHDTVAYPHLSNFDI